MNVSWEFWIRLAGIGLLLIALANAIVPNMIGYGRNLAKCERPFAQIFTAHAIYLVSCVLAMAVLCLWRPEFFLKHEVGRAGAAFLALFWGSRFFVQLFYYDRGLRRRHPVWNLVFVLAFFALGGGFTMVAFLP